MLKQMRTAAALITMLAVGACNSVTAPVGQADDQRDPGENKDHEAEVINVGDEWTPGDDDGGGGAGPGERDNDPLDRPDGKRVPQEWTPGDASGGGPGPAAGGQGQEEDDDRNGGGEGGDWTPDA